MSEPYPPAEPPADGDRAQPAQPRYSASASVPVPGQGGPAGPGAFPNPPAPAGTYGAPYGQGGTYGASPQASAPVGQPPFGQPPLGQPPVGQPPAGSAPVGSASVGSATPGQAPASGHARVAGSASVPAAPTYGSPPAGGTYGAPPAPAAYGTPPAPPGTTYGSSAPAPAGTTYGGSAPGHYGAPPAPPPAPYGQPPSQFEAPRPGGAYGAPGRSPATYGAGAPPRDDSGYEERPAPGAKPRRGLVIVVVLAAVIVVVGVGAFIGLKYLSAGTGNDFAVNKCVQQQGDSAILVDCGTPGAYRIDSIVNSQTECEDARQPWLEVTETTGAKTYRCLVPVNTTPTEQPSAPAS